MSARVLWRKASDKIRTTLMYLTSSVLVLGSVSFAAPLFFSQIASAAAPILVQADQNDPDTAWHTQDSTPTLTGATIGGTTVTVTVNGFTCVSSVVSSGWSCDGSFITTPLTPNVLYSIRMEATNADGNIITTDLTGVIVDTVGPVISERNPILGRTSDNTPQYDFNTDSYGVITFTGGCSSGQTTANAPWQRLDFSPLADGLYDSCTIYTTDSAGNQSNTIDVSTFTVDTTGPSLNPLGFKSWSNIDSTEIALTGDLASGWNLDRDGLATTDYYVDFADSTIADDNLDIDYHALTLVDMTGGVLSSQLTDYYNNRGVPTTPVNFLQYLTEAAYGTKPFAYIKSDGTNHPILIDAAKHDLLSVDSPMTIPGDFPEGEYNVTGRIYDAIENPAILDYKLIIGDITAPTLTEVTPVPSLTNDSTPSYTFNSNEAGEIDYNGSCASAVTTAVVGDNTLTFNALGNGVYADCQITVTDDNNNVSAALDVSDFEVDLDAPVTSLVFSGGTIGNNGWYKGPAAPTLTLSTESAATIYWRWGSNSFTSGSTDQHPIVTQGIRTLEFYSVDPATNEELPHQTVTIKYDRVAPTGTVVINGGDAWTNNTSAMLGLSASDSLSGVEKVLVKNGADASYSGPFDYTGILPWTLNSNEGAKGVQVKYVDAAGNEMTTAVSDTINLDMTAPVVTGIEVVDTSVLPFINYGLFVKGDVINRVRADVSDSLSGIDENSCEYTLNDGLDWMAGTYNSFTDRCIADLSTMTDGTLLDVNVRVKDNAGNISVGEKVSLTVDSEAPVNGVVSVVPIYEDTIAGQVDVAVPMSDQVSGMADCEFRYYFNGSYSDWVGGYWNSANQQCEINFGGMENGRVYELQMRGLDNIGRYGEIASSGFRVVDSEAPDVDYIDPTPADGLLTSNNTHTFTVEADDTASCKIDLGLGNGTFEDGDLSGWSTGGNASWAISTDAYSGSYSAKSGNMAGWNYVESWISKAIDLPFDTTIEFDWRVSSEPNYDYLRFYLDGSHYSAISGDTGWVHVSYPISAGSHTIMWNYTKDMSLTYWQDSGWIDNVTVGGTSLGLFNGEMTDNGDGTWSYGPITLPDGLRSYVTTCVDMVGNETVTTPRVLTIDTTAPTIPGIPVDNKSNPTNDKSVTWSWGASTDTHAGVDHYDWYITKDGSWFAGNQVSGDVTSKNRWLGGGDGEYVFYVRAVDSLGNASGYSMSEALILDTIAPDAPVILGPTDGESVNSTNPTLDWSDVDGAVKYRFQICYNNPDVDGFCTEERKVTVNDSYRTLINSLSEGDYWWRVRAIDDADNYSPWSEANALTIDTTDPVSAVDSLPEYTNKVKFNVNITSSDLRGLLQFRGLISLPEGSGVDYLELWYRKDNQSCPAIEDIATLGVLRLDREECVDGYLRYPGEFSPNLPVEFDTSLTGGDGYYEFFSVAVDKAGNREIYPWDDSADLAAASFLLPFIVDDDTNHIISDANTIVDTQKPDIVLNGDNKINLMVGDEYLELGAIWTDLEDGTGDATVDNSSVNTDVAGSYIVTYNYTDQAGNKADEVSRTVNVEAKPTVATTYNPAGGEVLGDEETNDDINNQDGEIKGESDVKEDDEQNGFLGLDWYWWLLLLAILGGSGWWFIIGWKRRREEE